MLRPSGLRPSAGGAVLLLPAEARLRAVVERASAQRGLPPPHWDRRLSLAARSAAGDRTEGVDSTEELQGRLEAQGLGDPAPHAWLIEGSSLDLVVRTLGERLSPPAEGENVAGIGLAPGGRGRLRAVFLRSARKAWIEAPPARLRPGRSIALVGWLAPGLRSPALYVEAPDGTVEKLPMEWRLPAASGRGLGVAQTLEPRVTGRYTLEIMAEGAHGPEVVWIDRVQVGSGPAAATAGRGSKGGSGDANEPLALVEAINGARLRMGAATLALDPALARIAQTYSEEMARTGLFAHVSPLSGDLEARLRRAGYRYSRAGENLAKGPDALAAHALAVDSPAHRRNMLDQSYDRCGVGVALVREPGGASAAFVTELFAGG